MAEIHNGVITFAMPDSGSLFSTRTPKQDNIRVVKLTDENAKDLAAYAVRVPGIDRIDSSLKGTVWIGGNPFSSGDWIVEEYDFGQERTTFRRATQAEREKYDLR